MIVSKSCQPLTTANAAGGGGKREPVGPELWSAFTSDQCLT